MTPKPTDDEMAQRRVYDPLPGSVHVRDIVNQAKDGIYNKDIVSSHVVGMLLYGVKLGFVAAWEATLFQVPFVRGPKHRAGAPMYGCPFIGPDNKVVRIDDLDLVGGKDWYDTNEDPGVSDLTIDGMAQHERYSLWLSRMMFAGSDQGGGLYVRIGTENDLKAIDTLVNGLPYTPGPSTVLQSTLRAADKQKRPRKPSTTPRKTKSAGSSSALSSPLATPSVPPPSRPTSSRKTPAKHSFKSEERVTTPGSPTTGSAARTATSGKAPAKTPMPFTPPAAPAPSSPALSAVSSSVLSDHSDTEFADLIDPALRALAAPVSAPVGSKKSRGKAGSKKQGKSKK